MWFVVVQLIRLRGSITLLILIILMLVHLMMLILSAAEDKARHINATGCLIRDVGPSRLVMQGDVAKALRMDVAHDVDLTDVLLGTVLGVARLLQEQRQPRERLRDLAAHHGPTDAALQGRLVGRELVDELLAAEESIRINDVCETRAIGELGRRIGLVVHATQGRRVVRERLSGVEAQGSRSRYRHRPGT